MLCDMDYPINAKAIEIIDKYMEVGEPLEPGTERICMATFKAMCKEVFNEKCVMRLVHRKDEEPMFTEWDVKYDTYFQGNTFYSFSFLGGRFGSGYRYFLKGKCELYFEKHARQIISLFLSESCSSIEDAILGTDCFLELWNVFEKWFDDRRNKFMENMKADIQEIRSLSARKTPQSHGGVANLLKVLILQVLQRCSMRYAYRQESIFRTSLSEMLRSHWICQSIMQKARTQNVESWNKQQHHTTGCKVHVVQALEECN